MDNTTLAELALGHTKAATTKTPVFGYVKAASAALSYTDLQKAASSMPAYDTDVDNPAVSRASSILPPKPAAPKPITPTATATATAPTPATPTTAGKPITTAAPTTAPSTPAPTPGTPIRPRDSALSGIPAGESVSDPKPVVDSGPTQEEIAADAMRFAAERDAKRMQPAPTPGRQAMATPPAARGSAPRLNHDQQMRAQDQARAAELQRRAAAKAQTMDRNAPQRPR